MKDMGKTKFCLRSQIEHLKNVIFVHQDACIEKVLNHFYIDKSHQLSAPIVVRSHDVKKDLFGPQAEGDRPHCHEVSYFSAIEVLMYLTNYTCFDI